MSVYTEVVRTAEDTDGDGNEEYFVHAQYLDETYGMISYAKWLNPKEVVEYKADKTDGKLEEIMAKYYKNALYSKQMEELRAQSESLSD